MKYKSGNMSGQYFTQWRVDLLAELLNDICSRDVPVEDATIWYDETRYFHYLSFMAGGDIFAIRFCNVFSLSVNGVDDWTGVLRSNSSQLVHRIAERCRETFR